MRVAAAIPGIRSRLVTRERGRANEQVRGDLRSARVARARALQHRRRLLRQAPARQAAMVQERFDGERARAQLGRAAGPVEPGGEPARGAGVERGDRVAVVLPPTPETAAIFFGTWKLGAILLSMSVLYGDDGIRHRLKDSKPRVLVTDAANAGRFDDPFAARRRVLLAGHADRDRRPSTPPPTTRRSCTTPRARPGSPRASSTPTATCSRTRSSSTATRSQDGERFHGMGEWAWAAGHRAAARAVAARRGAVRLPARGRLRSAQAARLPLAQRGHERLHDPDRDALDDGDRGRRHALPVRSSGACARRASRSTRRRSAGSASSTG